MSRTPRTARPARRRLFAGAGAVTAALAALVLTAAPAFACPPLTITAAPTTAPAGTDTTLTLAATSNGNYTGAYIEVSSTGGPGALTSFTTLGAAGCGGGVTSCAADGTYYKLALPVLTNGEKFSYTVDLNIDASTAPTTFTPKAEFFEANGTNIGPQTGPVITVTQPESDAAVTLTANSSSPGEAINKMIVTNDGPDALASVTVTITPTASFTLTPVFVASGCTVTTSPDVSCTFGPLADGASSPAGNTVQWNFNPLDLGTIDFTATITAASSTDPNPANNTATASCTYLTLLISC